MATRSIGQPKCPTGIGGFDEITAGGLPQGGITVVLGGSGAGKTVFSLQTLVNAARSGEPGLFVAFEEESRRIRENAETFGWNLAELEGSGLLFIDAYVSPTAIISGDFDLGGVLAQVAEHAEAIGARRVVFDGIDALLSLLGDAAAQRREMYRLFEWQAERALTCMLTAKAEGPDPLTAPQYAHLPFMADCVILLHHQVRERVSVRGLRVVKYRGSAFAENEYPIVITSEGLEVATYGPPDLSHPVSDERLSTGVPRLDGMLDGGYHRGSGILVTGSPGVAKTTLAASFADACCARGERVLFLSFDEPAAQIVRNMASVGLDLARWVSEGLLDLWSRRSESRGVEVHLVEIKRRIAAFRPTALIVDPLSALAKSGGKAAAVDGSLRLLDYAKGLGITVMCTSLQTGSDPLAEVSSLQVSTIADTWFHLSYHLRGGERNRALTVVKSRGTAHSNQVREMILSANGITLADVYSAGGEVLMGTARWEKEEEERQRATDAGCEAEEHRQLLARSGAELRSRIGVLQLELEALEVQRGAAERAVLAAAGLREEATRSIARHRGGDDDLPSMAAEPGAGA